MCVCLILQFYICTFVLQISTFRLRESTIDLDGIVWSFIPYSRYVRREPRQALSRSTRASELHTMRLDYDGIVNVGLRDVHGRWRVNRGLHVGHLRLLHVDDLGRVNLRLLVEDLRNRGLVLAEEDLRHRVVMMIHGLVIHGRVIMRLLVDRHHRLDVLERLMHRLIIRIIHGWHRRFHVRDARLRHYRTINGLLDVLQLSQGLNAQLLLQIGLLVEGLEKRRRLRRVSRHMRVDRSAGLMMDGVPLRLQRRVVQHFIHHERPVRHAHMHPGVRAHRR